MNTEEKLRKPLKKTLQNAVDSVEDRKVVNTSLSNHNNDFFNKPLTIIDELDGIFKAMVKEIEEQPDGRISITFILNCYGNIYPIKVYTSVILYRRSILFRLADALDLLDSELTLTDFLGKRIWVSVKTKTLHEKVYENIVDFANASKFKKDQLNVDKNGYFTYTYEEGDE